MKMWMIITGLILFGLGAFFDFAGALWFLAGGFWGFVNLYFIKELLYSLLMESPKKPLKIILMASIKFPVLYGAGFGLLYWYGDISWTLLAGFTTALALSTQVKIWKTFRPREMKGTG